MIQPFADPFFPSTWMEEYLALFGNVEGKKGSAKG
jgi:hypothetical protein